MAVVTESFYQFQQGNNTVLHQQSTMCFTSLQQSTMCFTSLQQSPVRSKIKQVSPCYTTD